MMNEDYVSFETAKLLKEKEFNADVNCAHVYAYGRVVSKDYFRDINELEEYIQAPTLQMAMKWLREVHNKIIVPGISLDDRTSGTINYYIVGIWYIPENNNGSFCYTSPTPYNGYSTYEEACEAAIRYCLENLI